MDLLVAPEPTASSDLADPTGIGTVNPPALGDPTGIGAVHPLAPVDSKPAADPLALVAPEPTASHAPADPAPSAGIGTAHPPAPVDSMPAVDPPALVAPEPTASHAPADPAPPTGVGTVHPLVPVDTMPAVDHVALAVPESSVPGAPVDSKPAVDPLALVAPEPTASHAPPASTCKVAGSSARNSKPVVNSLALADTDSKTVSGGSACDDLVKSPFWHAARYATSRHGTENYLIDPRLVDTDTRTA